MCVTSHGKRPLHWLLVIQVRELHTTKPTWVSMVKKALVPAADAIAEATSGIQRDLAARLADHGESIAFSPVYFETPAEILEDSPEQLLSSNTS